MVVCWDRLAQRLRLVIILSKLGLIFWAISIHRRSSVLLDLAIWNKLLSFSSTEAWRSW